MELLAPDYDTPWKDLLDRYFEAFMAFFFPAAHAQIDWARGFEFLDKELQKITADAVLGRRAVDKLVKVWLKTGQEVIALIHAEVQGEREEDFEHRVYVYHYRISDRFNERVATFVVLTDANRRWRPREYRYELLGTKVALEFSVAKLLDYRNRWEELEQSQNPFAIVVMAYLRMFETKRNARKRLEWKLILTKSLYDSGYTERDVIDLFRFLDWLIFLPQELQRDFSDEIERFEEERKMPYVTTIERMGIEKGLQKGLEQGMQQGMQQASENFVLRYLQRQFGDLTEERKVAIHNLSLPQITALSEVLFDFTSLDEVDAWLRNQETLPLQA
jgi:hypothetical protein